MSLSRRECLSLLLGAPLGLAACERPRPKPVPGRVVGASMNLGHRVRNLGDIPSTAKVRQVPVVIVGSGIAGLSAAWRLLRKGQTEFTVLELESRAGGTSAYGTDGVVPYPWAAHYLPLPSEQHESLCTLLSEMGVVERDRNGVLVGREQDLVRDPEERLFIRNEWVEGVIPSPVFTAADRAEWQHFEAIVGRWIAFRDTHGRRAFTLPLAHCSDATEVTSLDRLSAHEWLNQNGFRSQPLRWFLEYGCRDDYGTNLRTTSAWALLFYHVSRISQVGGESAPFLTWPAGNGRIVQFLERVVGHRLERNKMALDVQPHADGVRIAVFGAADGQFEILEAKRVILAVPQFIVKHLVRPFRANMPEHCAAFTYSPWMVANLHLKSRPKSRGVPLAWDNVIYGGASLGYVVATHQTLEDDGETIWTYYQPFVDDNPELARYRLAAADQSSAWDAIAAELSPAHTGFTSSVGRADVWHWGHAMVRPVPGFIWGAARQRAAAPYGPIHFAHTDLSGVPLLDEAQFHGVRAADEVLERLFVE